ncbi:hypothetical protein [Nonomuraea angiospora]|uniref:hypothetical protein n=1 Tax=Nonomuraea angiospora TaxID=46172 RepID=UPI0029B7C36A|nr:hypothetical protein [Nonomuraea angiospora]MDX3108959.1 hypothetical protein [Nonomuraea angiospora]
MIDLCQVDLCQVDLCQVDLLDETFPYDFKAARLRRPARVGAVAGRAAALRPVAASTAQRTSSDHTAKAPRHAPFSINAANPCSRL